MIVALSNCAEQLRTFFFFFYQIWQKTQKVFHADFGSLRKHWLYGNVGVHIWLKHSRFSHAWPTTTSLFTHLKRQHLHIVFASHLYMGDRNLYWCTGKLRARLLSFPKYKSQKTFKRHVLRLRSSLCPYFIRHFVCSIKLWHIKYIEIYTYFKTSERNLAIEQNQSEYDIWLKPKKVF